MDILSISDEVLEQLEFDKVLALLKSYCRGEAGFQVMSDRGFLMDRELLINELSLVYRYTELIINGDDPGLDEYEYINEELYYLQKEGYVLELESILKIKQVLKNYDSYYAAIKKAKKPIYRPLIEATTIDHYSDLPIKEIDRVFDIDGTVRPNASPELIKIQKRLDSINRQLDTQFNSLMSQYQNQNVLADSRESWRNGRRVLVLPVENKRKIPGIIHDQSASGKTVFIEPEGVMQMNNDLFSLESERRAEIYKILKSLSAELSIHREMIEVCFTTLSVIDGIRARAQLSLSVDGVVPKIAEHPNLHLLKARHPLLFLQLKATDEHAVDFDLHLRGNNKLLLISGPNAGGKSVTLKAVGLIHLMAYYGILVPADNETEISIFSGIFTDIGDQQSIDQGLSTYSSHLTNLKNIVAQTDDKSLILLDEIGSGTDPKLGGAIAEGILKSIIYKKTHGIVTTHYSSLKVFAYRNQGIVNGAMMFDKENLKPTYKLKVGNPGSSYAFEVARKIGLDDRIIRYARKKVGKKENQIEDLLIDLQEGKSVLDEQLAYVANEKEQLEKLIKTYKDLNEEFQVKRKKLQIKAKEITYQQQNNENVELQKLINHLQKEKDLEKAQQLKNKAAEKRKTKSQEIVQLREEVREERIVDQEIEVGDYARMLDSDLSGEVLSLNGDKAEVLFGMMKMVVNVKDLAVTKNQLQFNHRKINTRGVAFDNNFSPKLDIRGYKMLDAEDTLQEFFDQALLSNAHTLEVVHGKGSGALRSLVLRKMKEYSDLKSYWHPADEQGGDGVTYIKM